MQLAYLTLACSGAAVPDPRAIPARGPDRGLGGPAGAVRGAQERQRVRAEQLQCAQRAQPHRRPPHGLPGSGGQLVWQVRCSAGHDVDVVACFETRQGMRTHGSSWHAGHGQGLLLSGEHINQTRLSTQYGDSSSTPQQMKQVGNDT